MKLIVFSTDDTAGPNMGGRFESELGFEKIDDMGGQPVWKRDDILLTRCSPSFLHCDSQPFSPEIAIVASRHRSQAQMPALTCHPTGNFGQADIGGQSRTLQLTSATHISALHGLLSKEVDERKMDYTATLEVTHHGPTNLPFPVVFAEIGSSEKQWNDPIAIEAVTNSILDVLSQKPPSKTTIIGFGGPHYAPNFNPLAKEYHIGHMLPKYAAEDITGEIVTQMIELTMPAPTLAAIDWKGLKGVQKDKIISILAGIGLEWEKTSNLK